MPRPLVLWHYSCGTWHVTNDRQKVMMGWQLVVDLVQVCFCYVYVYIYVGICSSKSVLWHLLWYLHDWLSSSSMLLFSYQNALAEVIITPSSIKLTSGLSAKFIQLFRGQKFRREVELKADERTNPGAIKSKIKVSALYCSLSLEFLIWLAIAGQSSISWLQ